MSLTTIGTDEHVFLSGQTGTGKSFTAEVYLSGVTDVNIDETRYKRGSA
ncbi:hypothetical protein [Bacillus cereus]